MGMQDRDYYREWWRKKTDYEEKARFRVPANKEGLATDDDVLAGGEYLANKGPPDPVGANWHWSLKLLFLLLIGVLCLALRSLFK